MAHGVEIRVPLVDVEMLRHLAPAIGQLLPGDGKAALAHAPGMPLPREVVTRAKTGFGIPTGAWMARASDAVGKYESQRKGAISRRWSRVVMAMADVGRAAGKRLAA